MAAREQAQQTREKKHGSNPGTFSPDDDEAQSEDVSRARPQDTQGERRQAQGDASPQGAAPEDVANEDEDLDEDVDDEVDDDADDEADDEDEDDESPIGEDDPEDSGRG